MFRNYLTTALRNLWKNKVYAGINISGMAIGLACCLTIGLFIMDEVSYDRFHRHGKNIYRVAETQVQAGTTYRVAVTPAPMASALKKDFAAIEQTCRIGCRPGFFLLGDAITEVKDMRIVDPSFFSLFNFKLVRGDVVIYKQLAFLQEKNLGFDRSQLLVVKLKNELRKNPSLLKADLQKQHSIANVSASSNNLVDVINSTYSIQATQRMKEIGIRKIVGASVTGIVMMLSKDFLKLVVVAVAIASPIAWYFTNQWLEDFAYRITISWWIFFFAGSTVILITLITVSFQSIRAALMNPVKTLRKTC